MKSKRFTIILCLLFCVTTCASATLASLDEALVPLLDGRGAVSMSVHLAVKTLMPFDDTRLDLINRVLRHTRLDARVDLDPENSNTGFQLALGSDVLFELTEQCAGGAYLMQTSLLPNRMLFSTQDSPMDTLLAATGEEPAEAESSAGQNTSDVEEAFDMLVAVNELEGCYRALIDKTVPLTEKNNVSYTIEDIGRGRVSYVARLTTAQSDEMLGELRTVISCGMDAEYREELSQVTFARGFTVALYQNADGKDICVYIKGTIVYPDGDKRTLKWQWAFTPDRGTQTFLHQAARESGRRDSRIINASLTRTEDKNGFTLEGETVAALRRGSMNETSTLTMDLSVGNGDPMTCKGGVTRVTEGTNNEKDLDNSQTDVIVDLSLLSMNSGTELTGTAQYKQMINKTVLTELELTFMQTAVSVADGSADSQDGASSVEISILPADTAAAQQVAEVPAVTVEETQTVQPEFLVGTPPAGLYAYGIPSEMITVNMDGAGRKVHQSLMNETAQRLAGNLVLALLNLPAEDRELLSDGMTETDYAIFLAMLD